MAWLDEYRKVNPWAANMADADVINHAAELRGMNPNELASSIGYVQNAPGFWSGVRQGLGGFAEGIGRVVDDVSDGQAGAITRYGRDVQFRNPSSEASGSWDGFANDPWQGVKEIAGQAIGSTLPAAIPFAGGAARGAGLAARGLQVARSLPAQTAIAAAPVYGSVRNEQDREGITDIPAAAAAAIGSGIVESKLGVQGALARNAAVRPMAAEVAEFGATPLRTAGKSWLRQGLEEGGEEILQQPMQQLGAHQDPFTDASLRDTGWSGFGGVVGGLAMGPLAGGMRGLRHAQINKFRETNLLDTSTSLNRQTEAAQWEREFRNKAGEDGNAWYGPFMDEQNSARLAQQGAPASMFDVYRQGFNESVGAAPTDSYDMGPDRTPIDSFLQNRTNEIRFTEDNVNPGVGLPVQDLVAQNTGLQEDAARSQYMKAYNAPLDKPMIVAAPDGTPVTLTKVGEFYDYNNGTLFDQWQQEAPKARQASPAAVAQPAQQATTVAPAAPKAGTTAALKYAVDQLHEQGSPEHVELTNAITTAKTYDQARLAMAKTSPSGLKIALRTMPEKEAGVIRSILGWDNEGNQVEQPKTYEEVAKQYGYKTREGVNKVLKKYGITKDAVDRLVGSGEEGITTKEKTEELDAPVTVYRPDEKGELVPVQTIAAKQTRKVAKTAKGDTTGGNQMAAQLLQSQGEDGAVGNMDDAGFSVIDRASDTKVVEDHKTASQTAESNRAAAELGVTAKELSQPSDFQTAAEVRGEEVAQANREAAAAAERARAAEEEKAMAGKDAETVWDHIPASLNVQPVDVEDAEQDWNDEAVDGDVSWSETPPSLQAQWVKALVSNYEGSMSNRALAQRYGELQDEARRLKQTRVREGGNSTQGLDGSVNFGARIGAGEPGGRAEAGNGRDASAPKSQDRNTEGNRVPEREPVDDAATEREDSQAEAEHTEDLTPESIEAAWDAGIEGSPLPTFSALSEEDQKWLLGATDEENLNKRAQDVVQQLMGADALYSRQTLEFTDETGQRFSAEVAPLDVDQYPEAGAALDAVSSSSFGGVLDRVEGIYVTPDENDFAYRNPDGTYKIALSVGTLNAGKDYIRFVLDHELAHVADRADSRVGGILSNRGLTGTMVAKAKALYAKLDKGNPVHWLLDYPFNMRYPESKSNLLQRVELVAQLVAGYQHEVIANELKAVSPDLYNFAESLHSEIANQTSSQEAGQQAAVRLRSAGQGKGNPTGVFSKAASKGFGFQVDSAASDRVASLAGESGRQMMDDAGDVTSRAFKWFMSLHDLVGEYGKVLPSAKDWYASVRATLARRNELEQTAEGIAAKAGKLPSAALKALNEYVADSTFEQKWGYDTTTTAADGTKTTVKADPEMAKKFDALKSAYPDAAQIAKDIFDHGEEMKNRKFTIMKNLGLSGLNTDLFKTGSLQGPYAPLKRFGEHVAILKSQELRDAEAANDEAEVNKLRSDAKHLMVRHFDTKGQAAKFARENEGKYGWSDVFKKSAKLDIGHQMNTETLRKIKAALKLDGIDSRAKAQFEEMLQGMYLQAFDEQNSRMSGLKRRNVAGFDEDMVRSFLSHARAEAGFLANMEHGAKTNELFYKLEREAKDAKTGKRTGQDVYNAIAQHYAANLEYKETPIQDRIMAFTSLQQLATNPAYHIQNMMQPAMVTVPRLAADFKDYPGAWNALRQGYAIVRKAVGGGLFSVEIDLSKVENEKLRSMLKAVEDAGLLDVGMDEDLSRFEATRTGYGAIDKASTLAKKATHKLYQVSRRVEAWNRISAAVAAYNMKYAKTSDHQAASDYAVSVLQDTQGDFSKTDAPLIIKKLPKFMVQYRKFQLMMAAHYVKAFRDAFRSDNAETKALGRRMLAISLGHAFAGAGFLGLPLMNLVSLIWAHTGDGDEPRDWERFLREQIGDEDLANFLLRGPLWVAGMDAKLSQDKVFSFLPYSDWDLTSKKGVQNLALGLLGPSGGAAQKFGGGLEAMAKGDYYKGLAGILPSGLANGVHAFEVANKGYTLKNGDVMVTPEDISTFQLLADGIGLKSPAMRHMDWYKNQQWEVKQFFSDRSKEIERGYADATKAGDADAQIDMREQWLALQDGKDRLRYIFNDQSDELKRQPLSTLLKYPQTVAKRERKLQAAAPK